MDKRFEKLHTAMSLRVRGLRFCGDQGVEFELNDKLHMALDDRFEFVGDIVSCPMAALSSMLESDAFQALKEFITGQGLWLEMSGPIVDTWVRPSFVESVVMVPGTFQPPTKRELGFIRRIAAEAIEKVRGTSK